MASVKTSNQPLTIKEMAETSGLSEYTLRYYEKIGLIKPIPRDSSSGHRRYDSKTAIRVEILSCLRASGLSIEDMRSYLRNQERGNEAAGKQIALFESYVEAIAAEMVLLRKRKQYLSIKIAYWEARKKGDVKQAATIAGKSLRVAKQLKKGVQV